MVFQTSRYDGYLSYANLGQPATATVEAFARAAVAKAQSGATASVADGVSIASAPVRTAHTRLGTVGYRAIGTGPPLLLITGYGGTIDSWAPQFVDALAQQHRVITLDNAGIGKSDNLPAPLTIDAMADRTSALIDTLGLGRTDVLGWIDGQHDRQGARGPPPEPGAPPRALRRLPRHRHGRPTLPPRTRLVRERRQAKGHGCSLPGRPDRRAEHLPRGNLQLSTRPARPADVLAAQRHAVDAWWNGTDPAGTRPATIAVPTLIADGTLDRLDRVANSQTLAKLIHSVELRLYPDAGHAFLFQDQADFVPRMESFLR